MPGTGPPKPTSATGSSSRAAVPLVAFVLFLAIPSARGVDGLAANLLSVQPDARAEPLQGDSLRDSLVAIYKRSLDVKINKDRQGYESVFSKSRMADFRKTMEAMHIRTFEEYMERVAQFETRRAKTSPLIPQSVEGSHARAVLRMLMPKACGQDGRQNCVITIRFVKEDGLWKIEDESVVGRP